MARKPPDIGQCDQLITIQEDVGDARGPSGEVEEVWQDYATVWAKIDPTAQLFRGQEMFQSGQVQPRVRHDIWVFYGPDTERLSSAMRIQHSTRIIEIALALRVQERGVWWFIDGVEA